VEAGVESLREGRTHYTSNHGTIELRRASPRARPGRLKEERVAVVPGSAFGPSGAGHVRMCYATSYEGLGEALRRIARFVELARAEVSAAAV
jgi:aspartate/methionine/tyrosine aminotransferase